MKTIIMIGANYINRYELERIFNMNPDLTIHILAGHKGIEQCRHTLDSFKIKSYTPQLDYFPDPNVEILNEKDSVKIVGEIISQNKNSQIYVYCDDEKYLLLAAKVRDYYNITNGLDYNTTLLFRDKLLMKNHVVANKLSLPKYVAIDGFILQNDLKTSYDNIVLFLGSELFIVKPSALAGSFGFAKIESYEDFTAFMNNMYNAELQFMIEEFIDGALYHVDIILNDSKVNDIFICEYSAPNADTINGALLASIPLPTNNNKYIALREYANNIIPLFNTNNGVLHLELFMNKNLAPTFLEIGCRPPGAHVCKLYSLNYNINIFNEHLISNCNLNYVNRHYNYNDIKFCYGYIPAKEGLYNGIKVPDVDSKFNYIEVISKGKENKKAAAIGQIAVMFDMSNENYNKLYNDFIKISNMNILV